MKVFLILSLALNGYFLFFNEEKGKYTEVKEEVYSKRKSEQAAITQQMVDNNSNVEEERIGKENDEASLIAKNAQNIVVDLNRNPIKKMQKNHLSKNETQQVDTLGDRSYDEFVKNYENEVKTYFSGELNLSENKINSYMAIRKKFMKEVVPEKELNDYIGDDSEVATAEQELERYKKVIEYYGEIKKVLGEEKYKQYRKYLNSYNQKNSKTNSSVGCDFFVMEI